MFLSDKLENIIKENNNVWDSNVRNEILMAIRNKFEEEFKTLHKYAKRNGSVKASSAYAVIQNIQSVFINFKDKHTDIPIKFVVDVDNVLHYIKDIVDSYVTK